MKFKLRESKVREFKLRQDDNISFHSPIKEEQKYILAKFKLGNKIAIKANIQETLKEFSKRDTSHPSLSPLFIG